MNLDGFSDTIDLSIGCSSYFVSVDVTKVESVMVERSKMGQTVDRLSKRDPVAIALCGVASAIVEKNS